MQADILQKGLKLPCKAFLGPSLPGLMPCWSKLRTMANKYDGKYDSLALCFFVRSSHIHIFLLNFVPSGPIFYGSGGISYYVDNGL